MKFMLRSLLVFLFVCVAGAAMAQSSGISGVLKDEKGVPLFGATVKATAGGQTRGGAVTDFDGNYVIKPLDAGRFDITFSYAGASLTVVGVIVNTDAMVTLDQRLTVSKGTDLGPVTKTATRIDYVKKLIDPANPGGHTVHTKEDIAHAATTNMSDIASLSTQAYQSSNGAGVGLGGGRVGSGTLYVVDGVVLASGNASFTTPPAGSVDQVNTYVSGIPAKYGDASGGVITITTSGFRDHLEGGIRLQHSIDGYNNNLGSFNLAGPLVKRHVDPKDPTSIKKTILGFTLNGEAQYNQDNSPSFYKQYRANDATQNDLEQSPLVTLPNSSGDPTNNYRSQTVKLSDLEQHKRRDNVDGTAYKGNGKLIYALGDRVTVTAGGEYYISQNRQYDAGNVLFNSDNNQQRVAKTGRGYVRFQQRFANPTVSDSGKGALISNAFYSVQADYQKDYVTQQNKDLKHNTFDYGYIGKFEQQFTPTYSPSADPTTGIFGIRQTGYSPTGVNFTRDEVNPILANYTSQYYNIGRNLPRQINGGSNSSGGYLRNGENPADVYGQFNNVGTSASGYSISNNDQVALTVDASFDLKYKKTTHAIQFGLYYQQRNERSYGINAMALWDVMRLNTSRANDGSSLNFDDPTFIVNGTKYTLDQVRSGVVSPGPNDTIIYPRLFNGATQTAFDKNLRAKLGVDTTAYLNTDAIDRSNYSLDMFEADELTIGGRPIVSYQGYDYTGKRVSGQVNFNDYFTAKDKDGRFSRPIGAFRPNYIAGYLSDYIQYKDFKISLGVRVERFDANTKVLKDPYSLAAEKTVASAKLTGTPANIGGDFIPYVTDNNSPAPTVIGYRSGDTWYDANGTEVQDPLVLKKNANSSNMVPYLEKTNIGGVDKILTPSDSGFTADNSFADYKPVVNAMPRINFSFPLNAKALFYAHYDVMVQRPTSGIYATGADYRYLIFQPTNIINNSDLKPEKLIDYEVGFQQVLTERSSVTLSGFYKERKDQIQIRQYYQAYPTTYFTYGNRDFSTTKGLSLNYELHRISNLTMSVNYTLSFNEGTGSSATSANGGNATTGGGGLLANYIGAGLPNQRNLFPLDYDSRHNINAQIDYRFERSEGPTINGVHFLENAGANLIFRTRSGEPYTRFLQPNSNTVAGAVNASRLPWHYMFDLNLDKSFNIGITKGDENRHGKVLGFNVFIYVQNLFNTKDILHVYGYTGLPSDNGYLTSAQGINNANQQVDQQSYKDLYGLRTQDISYLNSPRRINFGIRMNF